MVLVQAPAGFGKTSLLAQWRREFLAHGFAVAWLSAQPQDDPPRFAQSLALSVRVGAGRPTFGHALLAEAPADALEGITMWLAEVAQSALDVVLFVDEADRLPAASRESLAYLLRNLPANLRAIAAARADCDLQLDDLVAYGECAVVGASQLRFTLDDALAVVRGRFGQAADATQAARLHEMTEGWPLGLQLALSVMGAAGADAGLPALDLHGGALREQFVGFMLANLAPADLGFLTRVSLVAHLHPRLAAVLAGEEGAAERLARLVRETPVFVAAEQSEWVRMHSLARAALMPRLHDLPAQERRELHARAADWFAQQGMLDVAAQHALAAGHDRQAYELAERSLYESMVKRGEQGSVLEWLAQLPREEVDRRPRLLLAAAWSLAVSERHREAGAYVDRLLANPEADDELRCECALILGGAANFADDPDAFAALHDPWADAPALKAPLLLQIHANRSAFRDLLEGRPALARLRQQQGPHAVGSLNLDRWGELIVGLSYLWEGQVALADQLLRPTLAAAEGDLGRRSAFATMVASIVSAAAWEEDRPQEVAALMANRLDVLERTGLPECVLLGYRTLARAAAASGSDPRAGELLGALDAVGIARNLPRLRVVSLAEQVRLHASRSRRESCAESMRQLDELVAQHAQRGPLWQRAVGSVRAVAHAYDAIAAQDWRLAAERLTAADAHALELRQGRLHVELLGLRAYALDRCGERARPLMAEAMDLAQMHGLKRVFEDAHPALAAWVRELTGTGPAAAPKPAPLTAGPAEMARAMPSTALTPKEREVLALAARNLSNKEIALAMQVGEETIKWHMKNLFAKLDAGHRKQVVARARILGLLAQ